MRELNPISCIQSMLLCAAGGPGPDPVEAGRASLRDGAVCGECHALCQDPLLIRGGGAQVHGAG